MVFRLVCCNGCSVRIQLNDGIDSGPMLVEVVDGGRDRSSIIERAVYLPDFSPA